MNQTFYSQDQSAPFASLTSKALNKQSNCVIASINGIAPATEPDFPSHTPSRVMQLEIIWITSGRGTLIADFQAFNFEGSTVFCLAPGSVRSIQLDTKIDGYYLSLNSDYLNFADGSPEFTILTPRYLVSKTTILKPVSDHEIEMREIAVKMVKEFSSDGLLRSEILKGLVKVFSVYLTRSVQQETPVALHGREAEMVDKFMTLVGQKFRTVKKVSDYAGMMCVTPNYLNQLVKRVSGFPASYHIQQHVIREAKRQAAATTQCMKEIAEKLGFVDCAHFSKFFKMYSGSSFSRFRDSLIN